MLHNFYYFYFLGSQKMETFVLEDLKLLGKPVSAKYFKNCIDGGAKCINYTQLVEWITKEIQVLLGLEEYVNSISTEADSSSFLLEVSSFLKESGCFYLTLTTGPVEERLNSNENKLLLLDYLIGELRASRMTNANASNKKSSMQVALFESSTSKCLKEILMTLKFPKPPQDINTCSLFVKINTKLQEFLKTIPSVLVGKSLVCSSYNNEQWKHIDKVTELLNEEFYIRRAMLLTRLDVTVQSFKWPDRLKNKKQELEIIYQTKLNFIKNLPDCSVSDFLCAREDLAIVEKTSSTLAVQNTNSSVNKVMIGQVPDRGGRPNEQQAPPPEMPSWQQRAQTQSGNRGSQSNRGGQFNRGGRGGSQQQNKDNQSYRNPSYPGSSNQSGTNVYQVTDGFQSISVGNENRNLYQNSGQGGRVQGGWNNDSMSRGNYQSNNHSSQNYDSSYSQGNNQNSGYNSNRYPSGANERQWNYNPPQNAHSINQDQYYGTNQDYRQNNSSDSNRRGYSKRGRGHNGPTYYNQQRNNQNY